MSGRPHISVVIPSWNGRSLLPIVLGSLESQSYKDFEVILVDDGSSDGSAEYVRAEWPQVTVLELAENRGFAAAANHGISIAHADFVALVNNDVELAPDWLAVMVRAAERRQEAGMFGGKVLQFHDRRRFDGAGELMSWASLASMRGMDEVDRGQYDAPGPVFGPNASAALYRRRLFERVGLFDPDFVAYREDTDLHFRAQLAGFRAWYEPSATAYHIGAATTRRDSARTRFLWHRNRVWLVLKNYPLRRLVSSLPRLGLTFLATALAASRRRELGPLLRAWAAALLRSPAVVRKRRRIQRQRSVSTTYLDEIISARPAAGTTSFARRKPSAEDLRAYVDAAPGEGRA